jgi:hypothetical protein
VVAGAKRSPDGSLEEAGDNVSRLCTLAPQLADITVAIHTRSMSRADAAKALLELVDPATLTGALVVEVLLAVEAYSEQSAIRVHMSHDQTKHLLAIAYGIMGLEVFAAHLDRIAIESARIDTLVD